MGGKRLGAALRKIMEDLKAVAGDCGDRSLSSREFVAECAEAMATGGVVELKSRSVVLREEVKVGSDRVLRVRGPGTIVGSGHCVFQAGGSARPFGLELENVRVHHAASEARATERSLGACVFALGKGGVKATDCELSSEAGFAVWVRQRTVTELTRCRLAAGRTCVATFNGARLRLDDCAIVAADPHGLCVRGTAVVDVRNTTIDDVSVRSIYAYMSPTLALTDVSVSNTRDPAAAAVQIEALRPGDAAVASLRRVHIDGTNKGRGLAVAGNVTLDLGPGNDLAGPVSRAPATGPNSYGEGRPRNPLM